MQDFVAGQRDQAGVHQAAQLPEDLGAQVGESRRVGRAPPELHAVDGRADLLQAVAHAPADAVLVHEYRLRVEVGGHQRRLARDAHRVRVAGEDFRRDHALASAGDQHGLVGAESGDVHADVDRLALVVGLGRGALAGRGVVRHRVLYGLAAYERVVLGVGELRVDGGAEERVILAPQLRLFRDVLRRDEAGHALGAFLNVGRVGGGDLEALVGRLLRVMGVEKLAGLGEGVADHQRFGGVEAHRGVHIGLLDAVRFVNDEQQLRRVKALDAVGLVGGEGDGESVGRDGVAALGEFAGEWDVGVCDGGGQLRPEDMLDLALRRRYDDDFGFGAGFEPPEDDAGGDPVFAGAVASDDGDSSLCGDEVEHFELLGVGGSGVGEGVGDEGDGVVAELGKGRANALRAAAFVRLGAVAAEECGNETHR